MYTPYLLVGSQGVGTFNQSDGTVTVTTQFGIGTSAAGTYNLDGGTLSVPYIIGSAASTLNFNGGTLKVNKSTFTATSLAYANVRSGGARIDVGSLTAAFDAPLKHDPLLPSSTMDGGLTKLGNGTLVLSAAGTYNGTTTISAGTLSVTGGARQARRSLR